MEFIGYCTCLLSDVPVGTSREKSGRQYVLNRFRPSAPFPVMRAALSFAYTDGGHAHSSADARKIKLRQWTRG